MKFRFRDDCGAALVELALTTPLFILLIIGAAEIGRVAYFAIEVESAARAGASYGAVNLGNAFLPSYPGTVQQVAMNDAPDLPDLVATAGNACVCESMDVSSGSPSYNPSSGTASCQSNTFKNGACTGSDGVTSMITVTYVTVSTQANVDTLFHLPGLPNSYTLHGYSEMRVLPN